MLSLNLTVSAEIAKLGGTTVKTAPSLMLWHLSDPWPLSQSCSCVCVCVRVCIFLPKDSHSPQSELGLLKAEWSLESCTSYMKNGFQT